MKTVTISQVMSWRPCEGWPHERIEAEVFKGRSEISVLDLLDLVNEIPAEDILWGVLRSEFFNDSDLRMMAAAFAEQSFGASADIRSLDAIKVARLFAFGEATDGELAAVWTSVKFSTIVMSSALASVRLSAREAARASAWDSAWAETETRKKQIEIVRLYALAQKEEGK